MLFGYMRVSQKEGGQKLDLQKDALLEAGVKNENLYEDKASGVLEDRTGLKLCMRALRPGDTLVVWNLDRLGRGLRLLVNMVHDLLERNIELKILSGLGAQIDMETPAGRLMFGISAVISEFERELTIERTKAGVAAAKARGNVGGRRKMTKEKLLLALSMKKKGSTNASICKELEVSDCTLFRYISPEGELRSYGKKLMGG